MNGQQTLDHVIKTLSQVKENLETIAGEMRGDVFLEGDISGATANIGSLAQYQHLRGTVWYPIMGSAWLCRDEWLDRSLDEWIAGIGAEFSELLFAVRDKHEHPWEWEAIQMASILVRMIQLHGRWMPSASNQSISTMLSHLYSRMNGKDSGYEDDKS